MRPEFICLQETRCLEMHLPTADILSAGYQYSLSISSRLGYAGTCILSTQPFTVWDPSMFPQELSGRIQVMECESFTLMNLYAPHGHRDQRNLSQKHLFFQYVFQLVKSISGNSPIILTGDLNVAHTPFDLKRPQANARNTMFTIEERRHIDDLLSLGLSDVYRTLNPNHPGYTWWPWLSSARANDVGWRIDYIMASKRTQIQFRNAKVLKSIMGSDHCPVMADIQIRSSRHL